MRFAFSSFRTLFLSLLEFMGELECLLDLSELTSLPHLMILDSSLLSSLVLLKHDVPAAD